VNGTTEGNGIWQSEGVVRRFKTEIYMCVYIYIYKLGLVGVQDVRWENGGTLRAGDYNFF
jgi:hypothetical protein